MKRKRKVTITKVRRQTMTVATERLPLWCKFCNREVETVSKAEATVLLQVVGRLLDGSVTSGRIHLIEAGSGSPRVCSDSLPY